VPCTQQSAAGKEVGSSAGLLVVGIFEVEAPHYHDLVTQNMAGQVSVLI
jgi:hypothetical protein